MVNPLLLLPLLNASILNTPSNGCYQKTPPRDPPLLATSYILCTQVINQMALGHSLNAPITFGRTVKTGHTLPDQYLQRGLYNTCVIELDMQGDGTQDVLTWREIIIGASDLRDMCVAPPPHLGGVEKVGRRRLLEVRMYGRANEGVVQGGLDDGRAVDV